MDNENEYTEVYTKREKIYRILIYITIAAIIILPCEKWFFPWLSWFASTAHCHELWGVSGIKLLWYGLFVGIPFVFIFPYGVYGLFRGHKIIKQKQVPLNGEKYFNKVKISKGKSAILQGYAHYIILPFAIIFMLWGYSTANDMLIESTDHKHDYSKCQANKSLNRKSGRYAQKVVNGY